MQLFHPGGSASSSHAGGLSHRSAVGGGLNASTSSTNNSNGNMMQHNNNNDSLLQALTYVAGEHPLSTLLPVPPDDGFSGFAFDKTHAIASFVERCGVRY